MNKTVRVTPAVVEGLRIVMQNAEKAMSGATHVKEDVLKKYNGQRGALGLADWQWFKGDQLAKNVERHAKAILAAVEAYRAAKREYEFAQAAFDSTQERAS